MLTHIRSSVFRALRTVGIACIAFAGAGAFASPITPEEVEQFFARYMANGRSNVEMQYMLSESDAGANGEQDDDHVHTSNISLYEVPEKLVLETDQLRELAKRWVFIHESEHALILPYLDPRKPKAEASIGVWVQYRLVQQVHENAADARAFVRIWKKDGEDAAQSLAKVVIPFRDGDGIAHQTQCAIKETIATLRDHPERMASDNDEFNVVLDIAERCALETANRMLAENVGNERAATIMASYGVTQTLANIHAALANVARDYVSGRFANNAATIRFARQEGKTSARDYHFYVGADNAVTRDAVIGGEGARGKIALVEAMTSPRTPERFFAIEAVKRVGMVTRDRLSDTEIVFTRFMKVFAGDSPERRARAFGIMASVIATIDRREPLGALYSEVNRRLLFDLGFPAE